jgi:hypothetical protein
VSEPIFLGYTQDFPYSYVTDRLVRGFPSWSKIRKDPNSIGAQFLNVFGVEFSDIDTFLSAALNNQTIGTANLGDVDWIYKTRVSGEDLDTSSIITACNDLSEKITLKDTTITEPIDRECFTLLEFYSTQASLHPFIVDFKDRLLYSKNKYTSITIDGIEFGASEPHHIWNVFDEFAMLLGLRRRFLESNAALKERVLDVFRFPGNSTKLGLIRSIGRELGLVFNSIWPSEQAEFQVQEYITDQSVTPNVLRDISIIPETFVVNGARLKPDQYHFNDETRTYTLYPRTKVFYDSEKSYTFNKVYLTEDKTIKLEPGEKDGYVITPVIEPSNLKQWNTLNIVANGSVKVDVVRYDFDNFADQREAYLLYNLTNGSKVAVPSTVPLPATPTESDYIPITEPIRLIINFSRQKRSYASPELLDVILTYIPSEASVGCIHDVHMEALHDDKFRNSLFDELGAPTVKRPDGSTLKDYVSVLNDIVPIMWGKFKWDEAYWDVVDNNLMGLHVLPNKWDPRLGEVRNMFLQTGIGYGHDCKVKFDADSWHPKIHSGYYYISITEKLPVQHIIIVDPSTGLQQTKCMVTTSYPNPQFIVINNPADLRSYRAESAKKNKVIIKTDVLIPEDTEVEVTFSTENYLYAKKKTYEFPGPSSEVTLPLGELPLQGAPIIVKAKKDMVNVYLEQVAFVDDTLTSFTIANTEKIFGNGTEWIATKYDNPDIISVQSYDATPINYSVIETDENRIKLDAAIGQDEAVKVTYKTKNSFIVSITDNLCTITLSDEYTDIFVEIESQDSSAFWSDEEHTPSFDPTKTHLTNGFLYISNSYLPTTELDIKVHPDAILGDGWDPCLIMVDCLDKWENPVLNQDLYTDMGVLVDGTGDLLDQSGTLTQTGSYYNRKVFMYMSPSGEDIPDDPNDSEKNVACTAKILFSTIPIQNVVADSEGWITVDYPNITELMICDSKFNPCQVNQEDILPTSHYGDGVPDGYDFVNSKIKLDPEPSPGDQFKVFIGDIINVKVR